MHPAGGCRRARGGGGVVVCLAALLAASPGCAALRHSAPSAAAAPTLEEPVARTRALSAQAKPRSGTLAVTLESWDQALGSALAELALGPSAARHRQVATEYRRLGILDVAHEHLTKAVRLDPGDAAAHDGLARIWRDWGFPHLGYGDSRRAVELAPASPVAANTLGTIYAAAGQLVRAHEWYAKALALDAGASYALNNFCYSAVRLGRAGAVGACERAVLARPNSTAVRNNLGLAYAAGGYLEKAHTQFARAGDAAAHYNMGMVYMAQGRFAQATAAFTAALVAQPQFPLAAARARQSRARAAAPGGRNDHGD